MWRTQDKLLVSLLNGGGVDTKQGQISVDESLRALVQELLTRLDKQGSPSRSVSDQSGNAAPTQGK